MLENYSLLQHEQSLLPCAEHWPVFVSSLVLKDKEKKISKHSCYVPSFKASKSEENHSSFPGARVSKGEERDRV